MPQSLILLKSLPDPGYLHDLQERGLLRASMNFLPGGCYGGAGLYDASPSYLTSTKSTTADSSCPDPMDTAGCLIWEVMEAVRKLSTTMPLEFNAFMFVKCAPGTGGEYVQRVLEVGGRDDGTTDYVETDRGREYVAAGHLIGCGSYNVVVEVLADDHDRLLEILLALTDLAIVQEYAVGRLNADDTKGFATTGRTAADIG